MFLCQLYQDFYSSVVLREGKAPIITWVKWTIHNTTWCFWSWSTAISQTCISTLYFFLQLVDWGTKKYEDGRVELFFSLWGGVLPKHPDPRLNRINRIFIPISCNFFSGSRSPKNSEVISKSRSLKNSEVKRAWPGAIWGRVTNREVLSGSTCVRTKCAKKTCVGLWGQPIF